MKYKAIQVKEMSDLQLSKTQLDLQGQLRKLRFMAGHGELKKVHQIKDVKKSLARILSEFQVRNNNTKSIEKPVEEQKAK